MTRVLRNTSQFPISREAFRHDPFRALPLRAIAIAAATRGHPCAAGCPGWPSRCCRPATRAASRRHRSPRRQPRRQVYEKTDRGIVVHPTAEGAADVRLQVVERRHHPRQRRSRRRFARSPSLMRVEGRRPGAGIRSDADRDGKVRLATARVTAEVAPDTRTRPLPRQGRQADPVGSRRRPHVRAAQGRRQGLLQRAPALRIAGRRGHLRLRPAPAGLDEPEGPRRRAAAAQHRHGGAVPASPAATTACCGTTMRSRAWAIRAACSRCRSR